MTRRTTKALFLFALVGLCAAPPAFSQSDEIIDVRPNTQRPSVTLPQTTLPPVTIPGLTFEPEIEGCALVARGSYSYVCATLSAYNECMALFRDATVRDCVANIRMRDVDFREPHRTEIATTTWSDFHVTVYRDQYGYGESSGMARWSVTFIDPATQQIPRCAAFQPGFNSDGCRTQCVGVGTFSHFIDTENVTIPSPQGSEDCAVAIERSRTPSTPDYQRAWFVCQLNDAWGSNRMQVGELRARFGAIFYMNVPYISIETSGSVSGNTQGVTRYLRENVPLLSDLTAPMQIRCVT